MSPADVDPRGREPNIQLDAAREAVERLQSSLQVVGDELLDEQLEQLASAVDQLGALAEQLSDVRSARRAAAMEAARQRRRYRELFDLAPDSYLVTDAKGVILEANRAAGELLQVPAEHLVGKPFLLYFAEPDRVDFHRHLRRLPAPPEAGEWEAQIQPRRGDPFPAMVRCSASRAGDQGVLRFLVYDLTDRRRAEQRELASVEANAEQARSLERTKSNFLRLASHELRGPLALLRGYVSMLAEGTFGALPPAAGEVMPVLAGRVEEMARMVEDMLEAARLEDGRLRLRVESHDLAEIGRSAVEAMRPVANNTHPITVTAPVAVPVRADRRRVATILTNLIDNAIKYQPEGGPIELAIRAEGGRALAEVRDHGLGIARDQLETVFKPFGRVVTPETSHIPGTGLGLFLSRELARLHGGDLELSSEKGRGTRARLELPLEQDGR